MQAVTKKCLSCQDFDGVRVRKVWKTASYKSFGGCDAVATCKPLDGEASLFKQATPNKLADNILFRLTTGDVRWI